MVLQIICAIDRSNNNKKYNKSISTFDKPEHDFHVRSKSSMPLRHKSQRKSRKSMILPYRSSKVRNNSIWVVLFQQLTGTSGTEYEIYGNDLIFHDNIGSALEFTYSNNHYGFY